MRSDGFFLGANTPQGFYSLYEQELRPYSRLYILKGGPGCGKSSYIRAVIEALSARGEEFEPISCSSDPDSLDGAIFPALDAAIVDGTSPHVFEPKYALAGQYYIDCSRFADLGAICGNRQDILTLTDGYRSHYSNAYRFLESAGALEQLKEQLSRAAAERIGARADGIIRRELKSTGKGLPLGRRICRFLDSICHSGRVHRFEQIPALCDRIFEIRSDFGTGRQLLRRIEAASLQRGYDVIIFPSPLSPDCLTHLLIPGLRLGFLTVPSDQALPFSPSKTIVADRILHAKEYSGSRRLLSAARREEQNLLVLAQSELKRAYELHEELESCYSAHIDFDALRRHAFRTAQDMLSF